MSLASHDPPTSIADINPYVGLRPFEAKDSRFFFGRREQTLELLALLHAHRFLPILGSSGSGKSSLVRAGLIPALQAGFLVQDRAAWHVLTFKPGDSPLNNLLRELLKKSDEEDREGKLPFLVEGIEQQGARALRGMLAALAGEDHNLLFVVDQFEELFAFRSRATQRADAASAEASPDALQADMLKRVAEASEFVQLLLDLANDRSLPIYVVFTMRSDFLGDCDVFRSLPEAMNESRYLVPRLTRARLREAIEGPALRASSEVTPWLVDRLLNDLGASVDQLPVLQHALLQTWRNRGDAKGPLELEHYLQAGGLEEALSRSANAALAKVDATLTKLVFQCLTDIDPNGRRIRRASNLEELREITGASVEQVRAVLEQFERDERHFISVSDGGQPSEQRVEITHESLIRQWPTLREWIDEEHKSREKLFDLINRERIWRTERGALLQSADVTIFRRWKRQIPQMRAWATRHLVEEKVAGAVSYLEQSQRRRLLLWGALGLVAMALVATTAFAIRSAGEANEARHSAEQATSAANASADEAKESAQQAVDTSRVVVAAGLTSAAESVAVLRDVARTDIPGWTAAAHTALARPVPTTIVQHDNAVTSVAFSPDGQWVVSGFDDHTVRLWPAREASEPRTLGTHDKAVTSVAFSPDGQWVVSGSYDRTVRLWPARGAGKPRTLGVHDYAVASVAFSPDGQWVVSGSYDHTVRLWPAREASEPRTLGTHDNAVASVAFSPDGQWVVSGSWDQTVRLWPAREAGKPRALGKHDIAVTSVAFSPDGQWVVSGSADHTVRLWPAHEAGKPRTLGKHDIEVASVAFSPDGQWVVSGSADHTVRLWPAREAGKPRALGKHDIAVTSVAFSPDGQWVVSGSADHTVRLWPAHEAGKPRTLGKHDIEVASVAFSPDGQWVVSGSADHTVRLWPAREAGKPRALGKHDSAVTSVAFSPDGQWVVSGSDDQTVRLWPAREAGKPRTLGKHDSAVTSVAFSPDGQWVVSGSDDQTVRLWRAREAGKPRTLGIHDSLVTSVAFSPDGQWVVSGSDDQTVRLWPAREAGKPRTLGKHDYRVTSVAFSPDGQWVVSGSADQTVRLWRAREAGKPRTLGIHDSLVTSVAFSPDGQWVVSGSWDHTVRLWPAREAGKSRTLGVHDYAVTSVAFSPDGQWVVSGSADQTVRLWRARDEDLLADLWRATWYCLPAARREQLFFETAEVAEAAAQACRDKARAAASRSTTP